MLQKKLTTVYNQLCRSYTAKGPTKPWERNDLRIERRFAERMLEARLEQRKARQGGVGRGPQFDEADIGPPVVRGDTTRETCSVCGSRDELQAFAVMPNRLFVGVICAPCAYDEPCSPERAPERVLRTYGWGRWLHNELATAGADVEEFDPD